MAYEKDKDGYTLDLDLSNHIIASIEKALDRAGVNKVLADISASLKTIATNTGNTASNTSTTNSRLNTISSTVSSIDEKLENN